MRAFLHILTPPDVQTTKNMTKKSELKKEEDNTLTTRGPPLSPWQASFPPAPPETIHRHLHLQWRDYHCYCNDNSDTSNNCYELNACTEHVISDQFMRPLNPVLPVASIFPEKSLDKNCLCSERNN